MPWTKKRVLATLATVALASLHSADEIATIHERSARTSLYYRLQLTTDDILTRLQVDMPRISRLCRQTSVTA